MINLRNKFSNKLILSVQEQWHKPSWILLLKPLTVITKYLSLNNRAIFDKHSKVWIVGNAAVGGLGKTPVVIAIANWLISKNVKFAILSKGYKGKFNGTQLVPPKASPKLFGDEACMMANNINVDVYVTKNRTKAVNEILSKNPELKIILTDDGLQDRGFKFNKAIMLKSSYPNKNLLPAGPMRISELELQQYVNIVLEQEDLSKHITSFTCSKTKSKTSKIDSKTVNAITAIANPERFYNMLKQKGYSVNTFSFPDHYYFLQSDLPISNGIANVVTAKDAVKISDSWCQYYIANYEIELPKHLLLAMQSWLR